MLYTVIILNTGLLLIGVLHYNYAEYCCSTYMLNTLRFITGSCSTLYAEYRCITGWCSTLYPEYSLLLVGVLRYMLNTCLLLFGSLRYMLNTGL